VLNRAGPPPIRHQDAGISFRAEWKITLAWLKSRAYIAWMSHSRHRGTANEYSKSDDLG